MIDSHEEIYYHCGFTLGTKLNGRINKGNLRGNSYYYTPEMLAKLKADFVESDLLFRFLH